MSLPKEKMVQKNYNILAENDKLIAKMWNKHVTIEDAALTQIKATASMPFVKPYIAIMPDCHFGMGATVGSVVPAEGAVMPSCVGVDIGCGMMAVRTNLKTADIVNLAMGGGEIGEDETESWLEYVFGAISKAVPHGRTDNGGAGDRGAWGTIPDDIREAWNSFESPNAHNLFDRHPGAMSRNAEKQLGTLGTGNHFIEVCTEIDNPDSNLWVVIHSGSRGFGNRIGTYFTKLAGELNRKYHIQLPNKDLGYLVEGTQEYNDYLTAVDLAQRFAWVNREIMMGRVLNAIGATRFSGQRVQINYETNEQVVIPDTIHMHHNYMQTVKIQGKNVNLTRKGAVDASLGKWCIIPGSMGAKTYIARGLGNPDSFCSCSHGAGRAMSRTQALKQFSIDDHVKATEGVYCDKTRDVLDETPGAYKNVDDVMRSQEDLVEAVLKIKQLVCVKGLSD